ncbi:MAG: sensor histidine kinase, partial [Sphingomonas sp.]
MRGRGTSGTPDPAARSRSTRRSPRSRWSAFDHHSGRFTGMRGTARRPRQDEVAELVPAMAPVSDSLRQLVHEL